MSVAGVVSGHPRQADDAVAVDVDQASGLSDAAALTEVLKDGAGLLLGEVGVEQRRALARGGAGFAGRAGEPSDVTVLAGAGADGEVSGVAWAGGGAIGILAAVAREVIHGTEAPGRLGRVGLRSWQSDTSDMTTPVPRLVFNSSEPRPC